MKEEHGKTIVQVKVPVCISIQLLEEDAKDMTQDELCGLVDEIIDCYEEELVMDLYPRRWMKSVDVRFELSRHWDELPVDEMDINLVDDGLFEKTGFEEDEEEASAE